MNSIPFATAVDIYNCASTKTISYHVVDHPLLHKFWTVSRKLEAAVGLMPTDDLLGQLLRGTRIRFDYAAAPLPFNHNYLIDRLAVVNLDAAARKIRLVYPSLYSHVSEFLELLRDLRSCPDNPLLECLESLFSSTGEVVVIRDARLAKVSRLVVQEKSPSEREFFGKDELRAIRLFQRIFLIGPPSWFPDHVLSAPRAPEIHVITYRWLSRQWEPRKALLGSMMSFEEPVPQNHLSQSIKEQPLENWPEPDWEEISRRAYSSVEHVKHGELVEARLFFLGEGLALFLDVSNRSTSLVIDPDADDDAKVQRVLSDEIQAGAFLLRRTESGGDYIPPLADQILGSHAPVVRAMQREWKEGLRKAVNESAQSEANLRLLDVSLQLIDLGAARADEANLRYWLSSRNIKTRDKKDFNAIMKLIGLASDIDRYWVAMRKIMAAHHQAGRRIRRSLLERVRAVDSFQLGGRFDFALPENEGGKLTAFLVEGRAPGRSLIPASQEGRIFEWTY